MRELNYNQFKAELAGGFQDLPVTVVKFKRPIFIFTDKKPRGHKNLKASSFEVKRESRAKALLELGSHEIEYRRNNCEPVRLGFIKSP